VKICYVTRQNQVVDLKVMVRDPWTAGAVSGGLIRDIDAPALGRVGALATVGNRNLLFALAESGRPLQIDLATGEYVFLSDHIGIVNCISCSEHWIASGGADAITNIWDKVNLVRPAHSVASYRDEVVSCAIGESFHIVASATRDGGIFLISTAQGAIVRTLEIGGETPLMLAVTEGWGFTLVYSTKVVEGIAYFFFWVFTITGDLVRKREMPFEIRAWTTWTSRQGFDYVAMVSVTGEVHLLEAFFLEIQPVGGKIARRVVGMKYFTREELLVVVTDTQVLIYSSAQLRLERLEKHTFSQNGADMG
jgi:hypothetical protein